MKKMFLLTLFPLFLGAMNPQVMVSKKEEKKAVSESQEKIEVLNSGLFLAQFRDMRYYHLKMKVKDAEGNKCAPYKDLLLTAIQFAALHQHKLWPADAAFIQKNYNENVEWPSEAIYIHSAQLRVAEIVDDICPHEHGFLESMQTVSQEITDKYLEKFKAVGPWMIPASKIPGTKPEQMIKEAATLKMIIHNYDALTGVGLNEMMHADQPVAYKITEKAALLIAGNGKDFIGNPDHEAILNRMKVVDGK